MAKTLAEWRKEKRMKTGQLASKAGVPFQDIVAYEKGQTIRLDHLSRLAKALYVNEMDILLEPPPKPEPKPKPKPAAQPVEHVPAVDTTAAAPEAPPPPRKKSRWKKYTPSDTEPARETQLTHLLNVAQKMGEDETAVTTQTGKPLSELTEHEASYWLAQYNKSLQAYKAANPGLDEGDANRPPNTRRRRSAVPEGVDEFELNYLQARQDAADTVAFTLFDGQQFQGKIIGFSPYQIAIQQADGVEMMLHKLAIAYYTVVGNQ